MMIVADLLALTTVLALASVSMFIAFYARMPWHATPLGRTLMGAASAVWLLCLVGTVRRVDQRWLEGDWSLWLNAGSVLAYLLVVLAWGYKTRVVLDHERDDAQDDLDRDT